MKNLLYVIAALLFVIWGILFWGLNAVGPTNFLLILAVLIILFRVAFDKKLSERKL
ncbi:hypothetical protein ACFLT1_04345 [Bacteroidota bacterium]